MRFLPLLLLVAWLLACDRAPRSSQPAPAPSTLDFPDAAVDAAAPVVTEPAGPVDAAPLLARAATLYPTARHVTVEGNAVVLVSTDDTIPLPSVARFVRRVLGAYSTDRFGRMPVDPIFILLFPTSDALAKWGSETYGSADGNLGTFDRERREIAVDLSNHDKSWPTIAHELVHVIVSDGKAGDFESVTLWFNECVATVFESPRWDAHGGIHGARWSRRYKLITDTLRSPATRDTARFDALFGMSDDEFRGIDPAVAPVATVRDPKQLAAAHARMLLHYASARYACVWLDDQGKLFPTRHRSLLKSAGLLGAVGGFVVLGIVLYSAFGPDDQAQRQPAPVPTQTVAPPAPSPQIPVATLTPEQTRQVAELRAKAHEAATKKKWGDCNDAYAAAAQVDPSGETAEQKVESNKCALKYFNSLNAKP